MEPKEDRHNARISHNADPQKEMWAKEINKEKERKKKKERKKERQKERKKEGNK